MSNTHQTSRDYKPTSSLTDRNTKVQSSTTNTNTKTVVRSGTADVRSERSTFRAASWKPCKLELDGEALTVINPSSSKRTRIPLGAIMELERTDLAAHALAVRIHATLSSRPPSQSAKASKTTTMVLGFASDSELYDWQDDLYTRSPLGSYSSGPFGFVHKAHVGVDISGNYLSTGDTSILPIYAEIIGGGGAQPSLAASPNPSATSAGGGKSPRSRPVSGVVVLPKITTSTIPTRDTSTTSAAPTSSSPKSTKTNAKAGLLEAQCVVHKSGAGMLKRWMAKPVWVTLNITEAKLVIHRTSEKTSPAARTIPLSYLIRAIIHKRNATWLILDMKENKSMKLVFAKENEPRVWGEALFAFAGARNAEQEKLVEKETQKKSSGSNQATEKTPQKQEKAEKRRSVPLGTPTDA